VFHYLEKPTWFGSKKKNFYCVGLFHFLGILYTKKPPKKGFFGTFSAKIGPFDDLCKIRGNLGEKTGWSGIYHKTIFI
jgi:hypothetical protein